MRVRMAETTTGVLDITLNPDTRRTGYLKLRLEQVNRMIVKHRSTRLVKAAIREKWGLSKSRAEGYIRMVYDIWAENYEARIVEHGVKAVADREEIIRIALAKDQERTALKAMDSRDRILGVLREHVDVRGSITHKLDAAALILASQNGGFQRGSRLKALMNEGAN